MLWILTLLCFQHTEIKTETWPEPVRFGTKPMIHENRLFIVDRFNGQLKVYDIAQGFAHAKLVWKGLGEGDGPKELPPNSPVLSLSFDAAKSAVWVNHEFGNVIFGLDGRFIHQIKRKRSHIRVIANGPLLTTTAPDPLRDRTLLQRVRLGKTDPEWRFENPFPVPFTKERALIYPRPELYPAKGRYVLVDNTTGMLITIDHSGQLVWTVTLKQHLAERYHAVDYLEDYAREHRRFANRRNGRHTYSFSFLPRGESGFSAYGSTFTVQTLHTCAGVRLPKDEVYFAQEGKDLPTAKFLTRVDQASGEELGWFYHPFLTEDLFLFHEDETHWYLWDEDNGHRLFAVSKKDAPEIKFPLF